MRTLHKQIIITLLTANMFFMVSFASATEMSLADCIATTVRENRTIKNAYLDRVYQTYDLMVAEDKFTPKLLLTPYISSSGGRKPLLPATTLDTSGKITELLPTGASINLLGNYDFITAESSSPLRSYGWTINLNQPLLKGAGIDVNMASVRSARLADQSNILNLKTTIMNTITSVISAYRSYAQSIKSVEINRQSLERSRELVSTNRELIAAGRMASIEIIQSEADVATKELSLMTAENDLDSARLTLTRAMDIDKNARITPKMIPDLSPVPYTLDQAKKLAFENRPDYLSSLIDMELRKLNLLTAKNSTLWDLSASGSYRESYTRNSGATPESSSANWTAMLKLSIPIGDLSVNQPLITAEISLKKKENELAKQREGIEIEIQDAIRTAEMKYRQIKLATQARVLSEKKVEVETEKLKAGRSTNFQLVSYQNDLITAQNSELAAVVTYLNAITDLENKLGITLERWGIKLAEK